LETPKSPADVKLIELVDAYIDMDGSAEKRANAEKLMSGFTAGGKKPPKKS
jgi:hypothetical protein